MIDVNPILSDPENKLRFNLKQLVYLIMVDWAIDQLDSMIYKKNNRWRNTYTDTSLRLPN